MRAFALSLLVLLMVGLAGGKLSSQTAPARVVTRAPSTNAGRKNSQLGPLGEGRRDQTP
jgi:hypothetical protein